MSSLKWQRRFEYLYQRVSLDTWELVTNRHNDDPWYDLVVAVIVKKDRTYFLDIHKAPFAIGQTHSTYTSLKAAQAMGIALVRMTDGT